MTTIRMTIACKCKCYVTIEQGDIMVSDTVELDDVDSYNLSFFPDRNVSLQRLGAKVNKVFTKMVQDNLTHLKQEPDKTLCKVNNLKSTNNTGDTNDRNDANDTNDTTDDRDARDAMEMQARIAALRAA